MSTLGIGPDTGTMPQGRLARGASTRRMSWRRTEPAARHGGSAGAPSTSALRKASSSGETGPVSKFADPADPAAAASSGLSTGAHKLRCGQQKVFQKCCLCGLVCVNGV